MQRTRWTLAVSVATTLIFGGVALAQPTDGDNPLPPPTAPPPAPPPVAAPPTAPATPAADDGGTRPTGYSIGIGAGVLFPSQLDTFNTYSVRVRLGSGLTIEPAVVVENSSDAASHSTQVFTLGANVRYPLVARGKFDFEVLGGAAFSTVKTPNMATPDTDSDRVTNIALQWGIAVAWWISPHFEVSVTATNPLLAYQSNSSTVTGSMDTSTTDVGLIFNPRVGAMLHVYY